MRSCSDDRENGAKGSDAHLRDFSGAERLPPWHVPECVRLKKHPNRKPRAPATNVLFFLNGKTKKVSTSRPAMPVVTRSSSILLLTERDASVYRARRPTRSSSRSDAAMGCAVAKCVPVTNAGPRDVNPAPPTSRRSSNESHPHCVDRQTRAARVIQAACRSKGVDPISMEPVRRALYLYRNGTMIAFRASSLFEYILASGDLADPVTRQRYTSYELRRIQREAGRTLPTVTELERCAGTEAQRSSMLEWLLTDAFAALRSDNSAMLAQALQDANAVFRSREEAHWFMNRIHEANGGAPFSVAFHVVAIMDTANGLRA